MTMAVPPTGAPGDTGGQSPSTAPTGDAFAAALAAAQQSGTGASGAAPTVAPPGAMATPTTVSLTLPSFPAPTGAAAPATDGVAITGLPAPGTYASSYPGGAVTSGFTPDGYYVSTSQVPPGFASQTVFNLSQGGSRSDQTLTLYTYADGSQVAVVQNGTTVTAPTTLAASDLQTTFPGASTQEIDTVLDSVQLNSKNSAVLAQGASGAAEISTLATDEDKEAQLQTLDLPMGVTAAELTAQLTNAPGTGSPAASGSPAIDPNTYAWDQTKSATWNETTKSDEQLGVSAADAQAYAALADRMATDKVSPTNAAYIAALAAYAKNAGASDYELSLIESGQVTPGDPVTATGSTIGTAIDTSPTGEKIVPLPPSAFQAAIDAAEGKAPAGGS